jgi:hypothetical protein
MVRRLSKPAGFQAENAVSDFCTIGAKEKGPPCGDPFKRPEGRGGHPREPEAASNSQRTARKTKNQGAGSFGSHADKRAIISLNSLSVTRGMARCV